VKKALAKLVGLLSVLYPVILFFALPYFETWQLAVGLLVLLTLRFFSQRDKQSSDLALWLLAVLFCSYAAWYNEVDALVKQWFDDLVNSLEKAQHHYRMTVEHEEDSFVAHLFMLAHGVETPYMLKKGF